MRTLTLLAFDDIIVGTAGTWYTPASYDPALGDTDYFTIHAVTTAVSGTTPTLTCQAEHSGDDALWLNQQVTPEINGLAISNDAVLYGANAGNSLRFARLRITLGGTSPQCRLKVIIAGRVSASVDTSGPMVIGPGTSPVGAGAG